MRTKLNALPDPFEYPLTPIERKHGPVGYKNYESYRDWLRDDFSFRCAFCLRREQWEIMRSVFVIDHFIAQYGTITAMNEDGQLLIEFLRLDNEDYTQYRYRTIRTIQGLAQAGDRETILLWLRYPENLPDLNQLRPPGGNRKPEGIRGSHHARRFRGALPEMY